MLLIIPKKKDILFITRRMGTTTRYKVLNILNDKVTIQKVSLKNNELVNTYSWNTLCLNGIQYEK